jgi:hypothetical protein
MDNIGEVIVMIVIFSVPIIAIIGGITKGILKTNARQRMVELAHRERLAALERGIDPAKLPPIQFPEESLELTFHQRQMRTSQTLLVFGLVLLLAGVGVLVLLALLVEQEPVWPAGLIVAAVGMALLIGAWTIRPRREELASEKRAAPSRQEVLRTSEQIADPPRGGAQA